MLLLFLRAENTTSIDGISPEDNSDKLVNALLGALGAKRKVPLERSSANPIAALDDGSGRTGSSRTTRRGRTGSQRRRRNSSNRTSTRTSLPSTALQGASFQDLRGSNKLSEGLLTTSDGSEFCVAGRDMIVEPLSNPANNGKLTFASRPELHDPACDDPAIDKSKHCTSASLTTPFVQAKFMDTAESAVTPAVTSAEVVPPVAGLLNPAVANASALSCTQGFTKVSVETLYLHSGCSLKVSEVHAGATGAAMTQDTAGKADHVVNRATDTAACNRHRSLNCSPWDKVPGNRSSTHVAAPGRPLPVCDSPMRVHARVMCVYEGCPVLMRPAHPSSMHTHMHTEGLGCHRLSHACRSQDSFTELPQSDALALTCVRCCLLLLCACRWEARPAAWQWC